MPPSRVVSLAEWIFITSTLVQGAVGAVTDPTPSQEQRLISVLLDRYAARGKVARPVMDSSKGVEVQFGIRLVHLDLDEKEQVMKTSVWVRTSWLDEYLQWDPADYDFVTSIVIPASEIWVPDIVLVNTAETTTNEQAADVIIKFNGRVFWAPQRKYSSACLIDVTEYPYDKHTCDMWFQSISNRGANLNISAYYKSPLDLDTYLTSYKHAQEWTIISNETTWHEKPRDVGMILMWSRRPSLRFTLTVQRKPGFKGMLLIVPCALLSFLVPLVFCFPPERPDRHTLAMSLFASLTILLFMVNEVAPPSASFVPRLSLYYCFNLLMLLLATCCSAAVVNISKRGETRERVPKPVKVICIKGIGKVLCFGERLNHLSEIKQVSKRIRTYNRERSEQHTMENGNYDEIATPQTTPQSFPLMAPAQSDSPDAPLLNVITQKLSSIENHLRRQRINPKREEVPDVTIPVDIRVEWRTLSLVLDRMFFFIFLIANFVSLGTFHPRTD